MKFAYPNMIFLLWIVVIAAGLIFYGIRKQKKILANFASKAALDSIAPRISYTRKWVKGLLLALALLFLVFSISGPLVGYKWKTVEQKGVDIMIALDCSQSMLCQDIKPSRLKRAKREIVDLLAKLESDRAGLVAFSGAAILQCPLTLDHNAFNIFLDVLEPDYLPQAGTDIAGAITTCLNSFEADTNSSKAIILITDGENTADTSVKEIVKKAAEQKVKIFCIGMGSKDGAPIPDKNGGFKKDNNNNLVISKVDSKGLKEIAALGNGKYVRSVAGSMDLDSIYEQGIKQNMKKKTLKSFRQKVWENRFQWFLLPCIILLFAELIISRNKKINNLKIVIFLFISFFTINPPIAHAGLRNQIFVGSDVKEGIKAFDEQNYEKAEKKFIDAQLKNPDNPAHYYNIGTAAYKNKDYKSALKNFRKVLQTSEDKDMQYKARFNIGNTEYQNNDIDSSIKTFEKLIEDFPEDNLAQENLEFIKKKKKEQEKKQEDNKGKKEQKKKKNQGQDQKNDQQQKNQAGKAEDKKDQEDKKAKPSKQSMLNRLSDKPGKAMMPVIQKQRIEKDW